MAEETRLEPSAFFLANLSRLREAVRWGPVVDLACGQGRHALPLAELGLAPIAIDLDRGRLGQLRAAARSAGAAVHAIQADLEGQARIPLLPGTCGAALVFRFLHRPLAPAIESLLRPGGLLVYETFTRDQLELGWGPRSDRFLLEPGELPGLFPRLEILDYQEGPSEDSRPQASARLLARKPLEGPAGALGE